MRPGDLCLALFPFGGAIGAKVRPVLLLTGPVGPVPELLAAYISSVMPTRPLDTDLVIDPAAAAYRTTNLKCRSVVRLHKLATVHERDVVRRLGQLSAATRADVDAKLRRLLDL